MTGAEDEGLDEQNATLTADSIGRNVDHFRKGLAKGVEWFTPDFISKLQGVDLMEAWRLGKKSAWWNAEGLE